MIKPETGETSVYFRLTPAMGPVIVLARNYDNEGHAGTVDIIRARIATEGTLTQAQSAAVALDPAS